MFEEQERQNLDSQLEQVLKTIHDQKKLVDALTNIRKTNPEKISSEKFEAKNSELKSSLSELKKLLLAGANPSQKYRVEQKSNVVNQPLEITPISIAKSVGDQDLANFISAKITLRSVNSLIEIGRGTKDLLIEKQELIANDNALRTRLEQSQTNFVKAAVDLFSKILGIYGQSDEKQKEECLNALNRVRREALFPLIGDARKCQVRDENNNKMSDLVKTHDGLKNISRSTEKNLIKQTNRIIVNRKQKTEEQDSIKEKLGEIFALYQKVRDLDLVEYRNLESPEIGEVENESQFLEEENFALEENKSLEQNDLNFDSKPSSNLSAEAEEFFPYEVRQSQIAAFLSGSRITKSIQDLPRFLQNKSLRILNEYPDSYVAIKGSAAHPKRLRDKKIPSDLDLEIAISGISDWPEENIKLLVCDFIPDANLSDRTRFHKQRNGEIIFGINVKDNELGLDLSVYDARNLPDPDLSWATSEDIKIFFDANGKAEKIGPISESGFQINPEARNLIFRIAFDKTKNPYINQSRVLRALVKLSPHNPIDYLFLGLGLNAAPTEAHQDEIIRNEINKFCADHNLQQQLKNDFIANLSWLTKAHNLQYLNPIHIQEFQQTYRTLDSLVIESAQDQKPNNNPKTESFSALCESQNAKQIARAKSV